MHCLVSIDRAPLDNIVSQINSLCGWPDGFTQTATTVNWSDKLQTFWCSLEDDRILSVMSQVNLNGLAIQQNLVEDFVFDILV